MYLQGDGNLVVSRAPEPPIGEPVWSVGETYPERYSNRPRPGAAFAVMQADGNFVLYRGSPGRPEGAYWASNTADRTRYNPALHLHPPDWSPSWTTAGCT